MPIILACIFDAKRKGLIFNSWFEVHLVTFPQGPFNTKLTTFMGIDELWEILLFHKNAEVNSKMRLCADVLKSMFCSYQVSTWYDMIQNKKITKKWKLWHPEKRSPVAALPHFNSCCCCCLYLVVKNDREALDSIAHS